MKYGSGRALRTALEDRLHKGARNTKDVDVLFRETGQDAHRRLADAARLELGDWFEFELGAQQMMREGVGIRVPMHCRLDSREFELFRIDIGVGDPVVGDVEPLIVTDLLAFAEIPPTRHRR